MQPGFIDHQIRLEQLEVLGDLGDNLLDVRRQFHGVQFVPIIM